MKQLRARSQKLKRELRSLIDELQGIDLEAVDSLGAAASLASEREEWAQLMQSARGILDDRIRVAQSKREQIEAAYSSRLRDAIKARGLLTDGDDSLFVVQGTVFVTIDAKAGTVELNGRSLPTVRVADIAAAVADECRILSEKGTSPKDFLGQLRAAYLRELAMRTKPDGTQVESMSLLPHLVIQRQSPAFLKDPKASAFREYSFALFRADLYGLLVSGEVRVNGVEFRCGAGASTSGAVFMHVPSLGRPAYMARVWFQSQG